MKPPHLAAKKSLHGVCCLPPGFAIGCRPVLGEFSMFKMILTASALGLGLMAASSASAVTVEVDAFANSSGGGVGYDTGIVLTLGEAYTVTADVLDTWSLGANDPGCTRESNADGLTACFGNYSQGGLSAPYGTLVGQIGTGDFFVIGSDFSGLATADGTLSLYLFDSNQGDNSGSILATITAPAVVPLPAAGLLLLGGLAGLGALRRRKTA